MGHVFISYSRQDTKEVDLVVYQLEHAGIGIWIDRTMPPGVTVPDEIANAIINADHFFLFISPSSVGSLYVQKELSLALAKKISIVPIILKLADIPVSLELQIGNIEYTDLTAGISKGISSLIEIAGAEPSTPDHKFLLQSLAKRVSDSVLFVTPDLIAPKDVQSKNIVVGTTINLKQLRDGCFMFRPTLLEQAAKLLDIHATSSDDNSKVTTFWIDGRSGSGKSVFLLQIMQDLVVNKKAYVFWLGNDIDLLAMMLEEWASFKVDLADPVYIFIDDFNSPQNRDLVDFRPISRLLNDVRNEDIKWPILVTCSPPEYLEDLFITGNDIHFKIQKWALPLLSGSEKDNLLNWFNERTNEKPKAGTAFEQPEGLILSMMFELRYGDMKEFGLRFKNRLEASGLTEILAQPLALNRLYIWPPKKWLNDLSPSQKEALAALNKDNDFSIDLAEEQNAEFIRLTHPHLSDVIYKSIRPQTAGITRSNDLANAFEKALLSNDILASRILRAIAAGGERIVKDLDEDTLIDKVVKAWKSHSKHVSEFHHISLAFLWTSWSVWAARNKNVLNKLSLDSVASEAIKYLGQEHHTWGILWQNLINCEPDNENLIKAGLVWLKNKNHYNNVQWAFVWQALLQYPDDLPKDTSLQTLLQLGLDWLPGHEDKDQWAFVWQTLLQYPDDLPQDTSLQTLLQLGLNWLPGREDKDPWAFVWRALLQYPDDLPKDTSLQTLLQLGLDWLPGREDKDPWAFVWQTLLQYPGNILQETSIKTLLQLGLDWLPGHEDKDPWSFIWQALLQYPDDLPQDTSLQTLLQLGLDWLPGHEDKDPWSFVWQDIFRNNLTSAEERERLVEAALTWLKINQNKNDWPFIWEDLFLAKYLGNEIKEELGKLGIEWLSNMADHDSWSFVFEHCLANKIITKNLLANGVNWFFANLHRPESIYIAFKMASFYDQIPPNSRYALHRWIRDWVYNSSSNNPRWISGWLAYWNIMPAVETVQLALKWIEVNPENVKGSTMLISTLFKTGRQDVIQRIEKWRNEHPTHPIVETIDKKTGRN